MKNARSESNSAIFNFWTNRVPHKIGRICRADKICWVDFSNLGPNYASIRTNYLASLGPRFARTSLRSDSLRSITYVRPFPKNTESLRSLSFSNGNDRKKILSSLRGNIDFSKKKIDFLDFGIFGLTKAEDFWTFHFFQKFE